MFGAQAFAGTLGQFAAEFQQWLDKTVNAFQVNTLAVEAPIPVRNRTSLNVLIQAYGAHLLTRECAYRYKLDFWSINVSTWRACFLGGMKPPRETAEGLPITRTERRKWLKQSVISECQRRGWKVTSNDAADALGLLAFVRDKLEETDHAAILRAA